MEKHNNLFYKICIAILSIALASVLIVRYVEYNKIPNGIEGTYVLHEIDGKKESGTDWILVMSLRENKRYAIYSQKNQEVLEYGTLEFLDSSGTTLHFLGNGEISTIGRALKQEEFQIIQASNNGGLHCWTKFSSALALIPDLEEWFGAFHFRV